MNKMSNQQHKREKSALKRMYKRNTPARYTFEKSPLWQLQSIHLLARYLRITRQDLEVLSTEPTYNCFVDLSKPLKSRSIQEPIGMTMRVHYRLARFLDSIERPNFLHSATRSRSNISNAEAHRGGENIVSTDIRKFYESTTFTHVKEFFHKELHWAHDLAKLMAKICTVQNHLPTGSCLSPLMSYFVHRQMFADVERQCIAKELVMTLYVDDVTISGKLASKKLLIEIKKTINKRGLFAHKDKVISKGHPAVVTGVVVSGNQMLLKNAQHKSIIDLIEVVSTGDLTHQNKLTGKLAAASAVQKPAADKLKNMLLRKQLKAHRAEPPEESAYVV